MFDKDLITSPSGGELASSGRSLQGEREANALKAGCEAETSFNLDLMIDTSTVQRWELEQAERSSNVGQAVRVSYHGIIWAGAAFGASVVLIPTMFFLAISLLTLDVTSDGIFGALVAASIAAIFGLLLAIFGGGCSVVLVQILNLSLKGLLNRRAAIVISGGLAGFLPIGLFVVSSYQAPDLREADFTSSLIGLGLFLLFTFGAMLFGHFGALFAADSAGVWKN